MRPRRDVGTVLSGRSVGVRIYMYCTNSRFTCFGDHHGDFGTVGCGDNASRAALRFVRISGGGGVRGRDPQSRRFWQRQSGPGARRTGRMESRAVRYLQLRRSGDDPLQEVRHGYPYVLLQKIEVKTGVARPGRSSESQPPRPQPGQRVPLSVRRSRGHARRVRVRGPLASHPGLARAPLRPLGDEPGRRAGSCSAGIPDKIQELPRAQQLVAAHRVEAVEVAHEVAGVGGVAGDQVVVCGH